MQNLQQQLHAEFDRVFDLLKNTLPKKLVWQDDEKIENRVDFSVINWKLYDLTEKREILAAIFEARDEKGEYILKEGDRTNPAKIKKIEMLKKIMESLNDQSTFSMIDSLDPSIKLMPETLRDLFFANCFGRSEKEIENLKLISW